MNTFTAILICEGAEDATQEEVVAAWQHLIDTGLVWQLQGFYGRMARELIEHGVCTAVAA